MGFFDKIFSGLTKTRSNMEELEELFQGYQPDSEDFYEELEELLVLADVGASTAADVVKAMRKLTWERRFRKGDEARAGLIELLTKLLNVGDTALKLDTKPSVILMVGVNGVGKTTTIGKIAAQLKAQGKRVLLCAGDTFRAAAAEQLGVWAERSGADIVRHEEGSDPAAVVYDGLCAAKARGADVLALATESHREEMAKHANAVITIPDTVELQGTLRSNDKASRELLVRRIREVAEKTAAVYGGTIEYEVLSEVPPLICDPANTTEFAKYMGELPNIRSYAGMVASASEDFAVVADQIPSTFMFLSAGFTDDRGLYPAHNPKVRFNEDVCPIGVTGYAHCAIQWLKNHK